jgi:phage-related protein
MTVNVNLSGVRVGETYELTENGQIYIIEKNPPSTGFITDAQIEGLQKTASTFRGIFNGALSANNRPGFHFCEPFSSPLPKNTQITLRNGVRVPNLALGNPVLQLEAFIKSSKFQQIVQAIRAIVQSALTALGLTGPLATSITEIARYIAEKLRYINKLIETYIVGAALLAQVERYIAALINFVARLPEIIGQALAECITAIKNAIASALSTTLGFNTGGLLGEIQALQRNITLAEQATQAVVAGAEAIGQSLDNFNQTADASVNNMLNVIKNAVNKPSKPIVNVTIF